MDLKEGERKEVSGAYFQKYIIYYIPLCVQITICTMKNIVDGCQHKKIKKKFPKTFQELKEREKYDSEF